MNLTYLYTYLILLPTFLVMDAVWIGFIAKDFYQSKLGYLFGPVQWWSVAVFYPLYVAALLFFVICPALTNGSLAKVALAGFFFGFIAYATYDLTNQATIRDWPLSVTIIDILWGAVGAMAISSFGYVIAKTWFI